MQVGYSITLLKPLEVLPHARSPPYLKKSRKNTDRYLCSTSRKESHCSRCLRALINIVLGLRPRRCLSEETFFLGNGLIIFPSPPPSTARKSSRPPRQRRWRQLSEKAQKLFAQLMFGGKIAFSLGQFAREFNKCYRSHVSDKIGRGKVCACEGV